MIRGKGEKRCISWSVKSRFGNDLFAVVGAKTSAKYRSIFWPAGDGGGGAAYTPSSAAAISSKEFPGFFQ
jgi:hypothetical protein